MNILIIGYGKMGHIVEEIAKQRKHNISHIIDKDDDWEEILPKEKGFDTYNVDVAIDFTQPDVVIKDIDECFIRNIPIVVGTTGWYGHLEEVRERTLKEKQSLMYSSNFAIGVFLFRKLSIYLANLMNLHKDYSPSICETHHIHKKDAPSGTALTLAKELMNNYDGKTSWQLFSSDVTSIPNDVLPIRAIREGEEFGTHSIKYDSENDFIEITHKAKNRKGLALGAILGAEFLKGRQGFFTMNDMIE